MSGSLTIFEDNELDGDFLYMNPNVKFIKFQSVEYREYLATAKYLINNVSFPGYFTKRKEQIFVDTWHGIPLKTIDLTFRRAVEQEIQ